MDARVKKRIFVCILVVILVIIATGVTTYLRYDEVYLPFSVNDDVQIVNTAEVIQVHDLEKEDNGYVITGEDAYLVYGVNSLPVRYMYIAFENEFESGAELEVFTCSAGEPFSADNAQRVSLGIEDSAVMVPVSMKEDVVGIRVDVMADEGVTFNLTGIHVDTRQAGNILEYFHFSYFIVYILAFGACAIIALKYQKISEYVRRVYYSKYGERVVMLGVWGILILAVFGVFLIGEYRLTVTNFMYQVAPWNSLGVEHSGPNLSDPADSFMPLTYKVYYSDLPFSFWNSNIALGTGESLEILWYPLNWIYFLPLGVASLLKPIIKISVAYFGMYFLTRKLKMSVWASVFSGIIYSCSSAMIVWFFWPHTDVMMLAPWVFLLGYNLIYQQRLKDALYMGIVVWLMIVSGMPTFAAYVVYLLGFFILFLTIVQYKKNIRAIFKTYVLFGVGIVEGVVLSLPYALSLVDSVVSNGYAEGRRSQGRDILGIEHLRSIFFPYARENLNAHINESSIYIGIAGIIFVGIAIVCFKKMKQKFWLISAIVLNILVFTHWLDEIFVLLPAINTSSKIRLINVLVFVICVLAGMGADAVWQNREYLRQKKMMFLRIGVYLVVFGWYSYYVSKIYQNEKTAIISGYVIMLLTFVGIEISLCVNKKVVKKVAMACLLLVIVVDMRNYCFEYLPRIEGEADVIPEATDSIQYMQENIDSARFYSIGDWVLFPETNIYYGLNSITSHNFVNTNDDMLKMMTSIDDEINTTKTAFHGTKVDNYELLKWCGVKYIVTERANKNSIVTEGKLAYEGKDGLDIYELEQYADKLFFSEQVKTCGSNKEILEKMGKEYESNVVYIEEAAGYESAKYAPLNDGENLEVAEDNEDYIKVNVTVDEDRFLVLNEYNDGKWKVYIDGKEAELEKVNYLFKAVYVSQGEHVVEFVYDMDVTVYLSVLSGVVLGVVIVWIICLEIRERRRKNLSEV